MSETLDADDLNALHQGLIQGGLPPSEFDRSRAEIAARAITRLLRANRPEVQTVVGVITELARQPVVMVGNDRLAAAAARAVSALLGMDLALEADDPRFREIFGQLSQMEESNHHWLAGRLTRLERAEVVHQLVFPGMESPSEDLDPAAAIPVLSARLPGDCPKAYVASALTRLSEAELGEIENQSDRVARAFSSQLYMVHQPAVHTHPARTGEMPHREVHSIDYGYVSNADVLVLLGLHASTGAGKELAWAERHLLTIIVAVPSDTPISRLITGSTGDVRVVTFDDADDLERKMRELAASLRPTAIQHMRNRLRREERFLEPWLALRRQVLSETVNPLMAARFSITLDRVQEIMRSPTHFAGASVEELSAIESSLGEADQRPDLVPPAYSANLGVEDVNALADAQEIEGWSLRETYELARLAERYVASADRPRRLRFTTASDWIDFKRAMNG